MFFKWISCLYEKIFGFYAHSVVCPLVTYPFLTKVATFLRKFRNLWWKWKYFFEKVCKFSKESREIGKIVLKNSEYFVKVGTVFMKPKKFSEKFVNSVKKWKFLNKQRHFFTKTVKYFWGKISEIKEFLTKIIIFFR